MRYKLILLSVFPAALMMLMMTLKQAHKDLSPELSYLTPSITGTGGEPYEYKDKVDISGVGAQGEAKLNKNFRVKLTKPISFNKNSKPIGRSKEDGSWVDQKQESNNDEADSAESDPGPNALNKEPDVVKAGYEGADSEEWLLLHLPMFAELPAEDLTPKTCFFAYCDHYPDRVDSFVVAGVAYYIGGPVSEPFDIVGLSELSMSSASRSVY